MQTLKKYSAIFLCLIISACGSSEQPSEPQARTPTAAPIKDPNNEILASSIKNYINQVGGPAASSYKFVRADLNNDGRREGLVMLTTPYGYWCETNGCVMLIFKANNENFTLVNTVKPIRGPIDISVKRTAGWKNLIVRVSGRWSEAKNVAMRYNGVQYPADPSKLSPMSGIIESNTTRIFYE